MKGKHQVFAIWCGFSSHFPIIKGSILSNSAVSLYPVLGDKGTEFNPGVLLGNSTVLK